MHLKRAPCNGLEAVVASGTVNWISSPDMAARSTVGVEAGVVVTGGGGGGGGGRSGEAGRWNSAGGGSPSSSDSSGE